MTIIKILPKKITNARKEKTQKIDKERLIIRTEIQFEIIFSITPL